MSPTSAPEVIAKRNIQNLESNRYNLIGEGLDYREDSEIGLLRLDLDRKYTEFYNSDGNTEELKKCLEELDDWTYEIGRIYTNIDSVEMLEGDLYYREEDTWKFQSDSCGFLEFSDKIFSGNILEKNDCRLI